MADRELEQENRLEQFLSAGSEMAPDLAGAAVGSLVGGPVGIAAGAITAPLMRRLLAHGGGDFIQRQLSTREQERIRTVLLSAIERINEKIHQGFEPRADEFFTAPFGHRPIGEEILEGVLIASQREHEERKIPFLANLFANISFDETVDRGQANILIRLGDELSYTQLCLLRVFDERDHYNLRTEEYYSERGNPHIQYGSLSQAGVLHEVFDLYNRGVVLCGDNQEEISTSVPIIAAIVPSRMLLHGMGERLCTLMELWRMDAESLEGVATELR